MKNLILDSDIERKVEKLTICYSVNQELYSEIINRFGTDTIVKLYENEVPLEENFELKDKNAFQILILDDMSTHFRDKTAQLWLEKICCVSSHHYNIAVFITAQQYFLSHLAVVKDNVSFIILHELRLANAKTQQVICQNMLQGPGSVG